MCGLDVPVGHIHLCSGLSPASTFKEGPYYGDDPVPREAQRNLSWIASLEERATTNEQKSWLDRHYRGLMLLGMALELLLLAALVAIEVWK